MNSAIEMTGAMAREWTTRDENELIALHRAYKTKTK